MTNVHGRREPSVAAGDFKQRCLALLDEVADTRISIVVTKRGRPVARLVPIDTASAPIRGSIRVITENEEELFSTGEAWEADRAP
jgi:prevent-host-death family protein